MNYKIIKIPDDGENRTVLIPNIYLCAYDKDNAADCMYGLLHEQMPSKITPFFMVTPPNLRLERNNSRCAVHRVRSVDGCRTIIECDNVNSPSSVVGSVFDTGQRSRGAAFRGFGENTAM